MKWFVLCLVLLWAVWPLSGELSKVVRGIPFVIDYVKEMFPPDFSIIPSLWQPMMETLQMGIVSIALSAVIALPISFLAAKDTTPNMSAYVLSTGLINFLRTMPTLLWAILFVAMVGLGPLAGVFALTAHCVGTLGKYFQEAIESTVPTIQEVLEAMQVDGATEGQIIYYGILPQVAPLFASYIIYYLEWCVRVGTTLGLVGAGGIGLRLVQSIRLFKRQQVSAIIILILGIVFIIHYASRLARKRLIES